MMKVIAPLLSVVCALGAVPRSYIKEWAIFKETFGKSYLTLAMEDNHYETFLANLEYINAANARNNTFKMAVNEFSDISPDDFSKTHFGLKMPSNMWGTLPKVGVHSGTDSEELKSSIDWVARGAVTPVKNQQQCGSCWAFSTTGGVEGAWEIATGTLVSLSEQQFVDCSTANGGCSGGLMDYAFTFAEGEALCTETSYPYTAADGYCSPGGCTVGVPLHGVTGYVDVAKTEAALMSALNQQPVSIAIEADQTAFQSYSSGVLQGLCGTQLDHGVLAVGYGVDNSVNYWKVKNSWGATWGEHGYVRMLRGKGGLGECGILSSASYPTVNGNAPPSPAPAPVPTPSPTPAPPPGSSYERPPCNVAEIEFELTYNGALFCSPQCSSDNSCPAATHGTGQCSLEFDGKNYCVDACSSVSDCPAGAQCYDLGFVKLCAFPQSAGTGNAVQLSDVKMRLGIAV